MLTRWPRSSRQPVFPRRAISSERWAMASQRTGALRISSTSISYPSPANWLSQQYTAYPVSVVMELCRVLFVRQSGSYRSYNKLFVSLYPHSNLQWLLLSSGILCFVHGIVQWPSEIKPQGQKGYLHMRNYTPKVFLLALLRTSHTSRPTRCVV